MKHLHGSGGLACGGAGVAGQAVSEPVGGDA